MRKPLALTALLFVFWLSGCAQSSSTPNLTSYDDISTTPSPSLSPTPSPSLSSVDPLRTPLNLDMDRDVTIDDVVTYEAIIEYLKSDYDRTEDDLLSDITEHLEATTEEIKDYLNWVRPYAAGGEPLPGGDSSEPSFNELREYASEILMSYFDDDGSLPAHESSWEITKTGLRYVLTTDAILDDAKKQVIIKIEFSNSRYEEYEVFQLKVGGINIDL